MIPLSSFVTLLSGFNQNSTNNFIPNEDYYVVGLSAFLKPTSPHWGDITRVQTSSVSALDYLNINTEYFTKTTAVELLNTNQPYLTGANILTNVQTVCAYDFEGSYFFINVGQNLCCIVNSGFDLASNSGNILISSDDLETLFLDNVAVSGIFINTTLSKINFVYTKNTYLGWQNFDDFLSHLADFGPNNGLLIQKGEGGYNDSPSTGFNPYTTLSLKGLTAMNALTGVGGKGWYYNYSP